MAINKHLKFEDLYDFWAYAFRESKARNKSSREYRSDWNGNVNWEEAKALAQKGWVEGLERINKIRAEISPRIAEKVIRQQPIYAIAGQSVDVGRFLSDDPECFRSRSYEEFKSPGRVITLVCSVAFSCSISAEVIMQRGAMICALVDTIEMSGSRVEVICNCTVSYGSNNNDRAGKAKSKGWFEVEVLLKKAQQSLSMVDLAFCLAHPAMLRRMMFSVAELEGWSDFAHAYGYPAQATEKGDVYIEEVFSGEVRNNKAIEWVLERLKDLGVDLEVD